MENVKIYDARSAVYDQTEMSMTELPPVPEWASKDILECGGTCNGLPNIRIVSGLDPEIQEWAGGRWWRKYAFREHFSNEYFTLNKPDGTKTILSKAESEQAAKAIKSDRLKGIIIPVVDRHVIEHGIPRYFVEYYVPPEYFGTPEAWESSRWDEDESGALIDIMGEFPSNGEYVTLLCIEEVSELDEQGRVIKTKFREIDDVVVELIKFKIEEAKLKTPEERHLELRKEVDEEYLKHKEELVENVKDIISDRIDRIIE